MPRIKLSNGIEQIDLKGSKPWPQNPIVMTSMAIITCPVGYDHMSQRMVLDCLNKRMDQQVENQESLANAPLGRIFMQLEWCKDKVFLREINSLLLVLLKYMKPMTILWGCCKGNSSRKRTGVNKI